MPKRLLSIALPLLVMASCAPTERAVELDPTGVWRAVLASPGGDLPFGLRVEEAPSGYSAVAINGEEEIAFGSVSVDADRLILAMDWYDSEITATISADRLDGQWRKTIPGGHSRLPFTATRSSDRFLAEDSTAIDVAGSWKVTFRDEDGEEVAEGRFEQSGQDLTGTFLTPTGDYRYLAGRVDGDRLRLSCFDGAHAFLFDARVGDDGTIAGDFWSRDSYHATWSAVREEVELPDPFELARLTSEEGRFHFDFEDLDGQTVTSEDERFSGKVTIVNIFGSWCPNCNDEAPLLAEWDRRYRERGLEIVGLAYEFSGDPNRDRAVLEKFAARHGVEYTILLAGTSDKKDAAATLPDLDRVVSYPTTIFIGRDGKVVKVHSGFSGPATGDDHDALVADFEARIESLLG